MDGPYDGSFILPGETDLFSNATRIVPQPDEDPRPWLGPVASGNPQVLTFIHEATHNWCFSSPVVQAQLHLATRAAINSTAWIALCDPPDDETAEDQSSPARFLALSGEIYRALHGDPRPQLGGRLEQVRDDLSAAVHDDLIRLEVIEALLRPLAEGLALFAEYDALSRPESKGGSPLPYAVALNFAGYDRLKSAAANEVLAEPLALMSVSNEIVARARLSASAVKAKASVLGLPFSHTKNGYLPGYLTVKALWRYLYQQDTRLYAESDLALAYLRAYFYNSMPLAAALLAPTIPNSVTSANAILDAFGGRFGDFLRVAPADVSAFEDYLDSPAAGDDYHVPGLLSSAGEDKRAFDALTAAIDGYQQSSIAAQIYREGAAAEISRLKRLARQRSFITVCSVPVQIEPLPANGGMTISWQGEPVLTLSPEDLAPPNLTAHSGTTIGQGHLDVLLGTFGTTMMSRAAVISVQHEVGDQVLACTAWGTPEGKDVMRQEILAGFASREERLRTSRGLRAFAELIVQDDDTGLRLNKDLVIGQTGKIVDSMYQSKALLFARTEEEADQCAELMQDKGAYALLGSAGLLKRAALLGLGAGLNSYRETLDRIFRQHGYDLDDTLEKLNQCWDQYGFPPSVWESPGEDSILIPWI
jgi:hypothetical protein